MKYQIFLAEDWVDVKRGEFVDSPWDTKTLQYELYDGSSGHTIHWRVVEDKRALDAAEELVSWEPAFRQPTRNIA